MKNNLIFISLLFCVCISCKKNNAEYHSITDKIHDKSKNYHETSISSEAYLQELELIKITEGEHTFLIPERKKQIKSFACTECHSKPLSEMQGSSDSKKAHWDIKLMHADTGVMNCTTCHNGNDMDHLTTITGNKVDFNNSYTLCAQCHTSQFEDWKGGAHGKKVEGWAPPRASMTCVNCHNPHNPSFKTRWPSRFNTQKVKERNEELVH
ncbi:cytochrome c3 family protein [Aquimarina algicola]|uniref:Cytochrome C n=1 Tax=Aquimarina algicola TaxID=2589995 RepID=A0A504JFN2_9FLAO|nr:cytochrome c3 family protein [Aquimarina algicola]TPN85231.1 cytochrome C [Aquimarina algicola]